MALFHLSVTQTKRSAGQSAIASAAYRAGARLYSEYYGEYSDYTRKGGVICSDILLPSHAPPEYADRQTLWNAVEKAERGKNAQLAYSFDIALQNEFSLEENIALARQFLLENFVSRGMVVDFAVHQPDREDGGIPNPHFHVLCPIRPIEQNGKWGLKQRRPAMTDSRTLGQSVPKEGLFLMDGIEGLRSLPKHSVDMLLTDPPYGTTRNYWDVPLPLPELWEAVKWAVKPNGAVLFFAQCPFDKVLGASNLAMLRYEWIWYKERGTGFLNANRAPLKKSENILVFYQKSPVYNPQFTYGKPYTRVHSRSGTSSNYGKFERQGSESNDGRRYPGNVLFVPTVSGGIHPTQKPVELCEYLIRTYTRPGELVADICVGSGTTAIAAINTERRFVCFETAPSFYAAASERIRAAQAVKSSGEKGV